MRRLALLTLALASSCKDPVSTDDTDTDAETDTDVAAETDDTEVEEETDGPGVPNAGADGVWSLSSAGSVCDMNFAGDWLGAPTEGETLAFTLTQQIEGGRVLTCLFDAVAPTQFSCTDQSVNGQIPPNCSVTVSVTGVSGSVSGDAASLSVTLQRTSPNCGQALNCGPSPHAVSGTIAR